MKRAYIPSKKEKYAVERYVHEFGPKLDKYGKRRWRPKAECLACGESVHSIGENGPLRDATWGHDPGGPWCPVKEKGGGKYKLLPPATPNQEAGKTLRAAFFAQWERHWGFICKLAPMSDIHTLIGFIQHADSIRLWEQRGLQEWHLPYIFLTMCDNPPPKSAKGSAVRGEWLRFRFDARIRTIEALWIRVEPDWMLLKLIYRVPARGAEPGPKHLIDVQPVAPEPDFMISGTLLPPPHPYQVSEMAKAFPDELRSPALAPI